MCPLISKFALLTSVDVNKDKTANVCEYKIGNDASSFSLYQTVKQLLPNYMLQVYYKNTDEIDRRTKDITNWLV